ncbi:formylglycine-generating enzyme family protein [Leptolyngbyaceae cyanobacterium CCMR0082]|uniref:Formylglycine-generating enzyme family protein n=2 Tax=Adonisia turfae TaxID=2950184 RepID=A0A6M0SCQ1_9CYAN|nr:formylglycine-generating enzyme family protein [Adonisia turfae]NEZ59986.1 formylglycine-generating enzyme family protein [Adonisia turfae CCMR0081]NEZ65452.1 formylglycine-generating enzyme family protein [Adonisia turfae CCMR0082]
MSGSRRYQVIKQIGGASMAALTQDSRICHNPFWSSRSLQYQCSRRKALKFLGVSTATAVVTVGCKNAAATITPTGQPLKSRGLKTVQVDSNGQITAEPSIRVDYFDEPLLRRQLRKVLPLRMVQIPAGEFLMGSPPSEPKREEQEGPQRSIQVPSFYLGAFVVTQRQYEAVMGNNPSYFTDDQGEDGADLPVEQITWDDADIFCQQLSELTGRNYRLPSEAEWEYACRAGTTTPFSFGEALTTEIANFFADFSFTENYEENYRNNPVKADSFWPNAFGLYNMHGNVHEWCSDDYHESYEGAPSDANKWLSGNATASKVMRGGSWFNDTHFCRSAARDKNTQVGRSNSCGFRVVCEPKR